MDITRRMPLYVGKKCNSACQFCYYLSEINKKNESYEDIVETLTQYKKYGIKSIDLTGGEPTVHKDIIKITETAVKMGFKDISIITNGIALRNRQLIDKLVEAGVHTFVLSIHGHNAERHEKLTQVKGSFNNLIETIDYFNEKEIPFAVNIVVNIHNYQYLQEYASLVKGLKCGGGVTFLVLNPLNDGVINFDKLSVRYSEVNKYLSGALSILEEANIQCKWKFMPLCASSENIKHTHNIYQFFYNPYDWNYKVHIINIAGYISYLYILFKNFSFFNRKQLWNIPFKTLCYLAALNESFDNYYTKIPECKSCKYLYVCDGINLNYLNLYGTEEFKAIPGKKLINPVDVLDKSPKASIPEKFLNLFFFGFSNLIYGLISLFLGKIVRRAYENAHKRP